MAILDDVKIRLGQMHMEDRVDPSTGETYSEAVFDELEQNPKIESFINTNRDLILANVMPPSYYTTGQIEELLQHYSSAIVELTLYDCVKDGAFYQDSHSEPGVTLKWNKKMDILKEYRISPLAKIGKR